MRPAFALVAVLLAVGCSWAVRSGGAVGTAAGASGGPSAVAWLLVGCPGGALTPGPLAGSWRLVGCAGGPAGQDPQSAASWLLVGCTGAALSPGPLPGSWLLGCPGAR